MSRYILSFSAMILTAAAAAQNVTGTAKDPELARQFEQTASAFKSVIASAEAANGAGVEKHLKASTDRWRETFKKYRHWATADVNWQSDFDAIHATLVNATNAYSPGNDLPKVATHMQSALDTLDGLRNRNGVPDLEGNIADVQNSLTKIGENVRKLQGRSPSMADLKTYAETWQEAQGAWNKFVQGLLDFNALGLGDGQLQNLQNRIDTQNELFQLIIGAINSPNMAALLANIEDSQERLEVIREQVEELTGDDTADGEPAGGLVPVDPQPQPENKRRPLFPLLGR